MNCKTLLEVYNQLEMQHTFIVSAENEIIISAAEFKKNVEAILYNLQTFGIKPGDELLFQINDEIRFVETFWACILGKIIPVPYTYLETGKEHYKLAGVWEGLTNPYLITDKKSFDTFKDNLSSEFFKKINKKTIIIENINYDTSNIKRQIPNENDIAFIQFSSGSTSEPKGVVVTHKNIIASINATIRAMRVTEKDIYLSWLPLTHSFGLIGTYLTPLIARCQFYIMPTKLFVTHPLLWLDRISNHKVTITASPNFGLKHVCRYVQHINKQNFDLSSLRIIIDGAEPVSAEVCEEFTNKMTNFNMKSNVVKPSYGLSEATLVVSTPEYCDSYTEVLVERKHVRIGQKIIEHEVHSNNSMKFVEVGRILDNIDSKIVDDEGKVLEEGFVGHLLLKGEAIFKEYYKNQKATEETKDLQGWLDTGDLGFFHNGNLVLTGREKDVIFIKGENFYAHDLENICNEIAEGDFSKTAICGEYDVHREKVICFVEYNQEKESFSEIQNRIKRHVLSKVGIGITEVIPVKEIPVTVSGKLKRYILLEQYRQGLL